MKLQKDLFKLSDLNNINIATLLEISDVLKKHLTLHRVKYKDTYFWIDSDGLKSIAIDLSKIYGLNQKMITYIYAYKLSGLLRSNSLVNTKIKTLNGYSEKIQKKTQPRKVINKASIWSDNDINALILLFPTNKMKDLSKFFNKSYYAVEYKAKQLNLRKKNK